MPAAADDDVVVQRNAERGGGFKDVFGGSCKTLRRCRFFQLLRVRTRFGEYARSSRCGMLNCRETTTTRSYGRVPA